MTLVSLEARIQCFVTFFFQFRMMFVRTVFSLSVSEKATLTKVQFFINANLPCFDHVTLITTVLLPLSCAHSEVYISE